MIILGIDPGIAIVGYGIIEYKNNKFRVIDYGAVTTPAHMDILRRLELVYKGIDMLIKNYNIDEVGIEELFFNKNVKTAITVAQARGVTMLACAHNNIPVYEYTPLQVKQGVVGYGRAQKAQVQQMVKSFLNLKAIPKPDDVADALAVAICHCHSNKLEKTLKNIGGNMYSYIKGKIEEINLDSLVIEANNIGYKVNVSANTLADVKLGKECKIHTKLIVREDDMSLCGFSTKEELKMFELLNSVSKIGPKVALGILSFATPKQIGAYIVSEDVAKMSKAPGVGKKTAERIILELKDKIDKNNIEFEPTLLSQMPIAISQDEAVDALIALGYSSQESKEAVDKCKKDGMNTEDIIKKSLSYIMSKSLR